MARKNMFAGITPPTRSDTAPQRRTEVETPEVFQQGGPIAAIRNDLRNLGTRSVQEIEPELIEDTGFRDRLGNIEIDLAELRASIAAHGQQVPVLLRPHPKERGRFQVVYGRRRLAAIRGLGIPVKALVRTLTDEEAVLAQGQENNLRKDPSFIEKALFAGDLENAGYDARVIQDALNISRSHTSHMRKVREAFPRDLIEMIGPAPSIGWKRWYDGAVALLGAKVDPYTVHPDAFPAGSDSDSRFTLWMAALERGLSPAPRRKQTRSAAQIDITSAEGKHIGAFSRRGATIALRVSSENADFAEWLDRNSESVFRTLHHRFLEQRASKDD